MRSVEQALLIPCQGDHLVGVLHRPTQGPEGDLGMVVIVGGPQYRAGSHRQFTLLARAVAAQGTPVLRSDYRGMGDSTGSLHTFEQVHDDVAAAVDALQRQLPQIRRVVLWGLCDGASAALLYWQRGGDTRVTGLCLLNPWVRSAATLARAHVKHYYLRRLGQRAFWIKFLRGGVASHAIKDLLRSLQEAIGKPRSGGVLRNEATFQELMARSASAFPGNMLLILSGNDYTAKEFVEEVATEPRWAQCMGRSATTRLDFATADHTFSAINAQQAMERAIVAWLDQQRQRDELSPVQVA